MSLDFSRTHVRVWMLYVAGMVQLHPEGARRRPSRVSPASATAGRAPLMKERPSRGPGGARARARTDRNLPDMWQLNRAASAALCLHTIRTQWSLSRNEGKRVPFGRWCRPNEEGINRAARRCANPRVGQLPSAHVALCAYLQPQSEPRKAWQVPAMGLVQNPHRASYKPLMGRIWAHGRPRA